MRLHRSVSLGCIAAAGALAACGKGPDPATTGGDVSSVLVSTVASGGYLGSATLDGQGHVYVTSGGGLSEVVFAPGAAISSSWGGAGAQAEIELAVGGTTLWWAANDGTGPAYWSSAASSFATASGAGTRVAVAPASDVIGLVVDGTTLYAALSTPVASASSQASPVGPSPDSWQYPGSPAVDTPFAGSLYRVTTARPTTTTRLATTGVTFFPGFMQHVLAQSTTEVYWVDSTVTPTEVGRVMTASKLAWTTDIGHRVGGIPAVSGVATGFVGLAASGDFVAWAAAPEPYFGASGCTVWVSEKDAVAKEIFDAASNGTPLLCNGLAIDGQYAYFATVQVVAPPAGAASDVLVGTGVGRVPLAGGALQTVSLRSDRWYGPRRVLVDADNVYTVDPSYVASFPKSAFGD